MTTAFTPISAARTAAKDALLAALDEAGTMSRLAEHDTEGDRDDVDA